MKRQDFVNMLRGSLTAVIGEKIANDRIRFTDDTKTQAEQGERLVREAANNAATGPWLEIGETLEDVADAHAQLDRQNIERNYATEEPMPLSVRVGLLAIRVLHSHTPPPPVARGPIKLATCTCNPCVVTCVQCNKLPPYQSEQLRGALADLVGTIASGDHAKVIAVAERVASLFKEQAR